jgi:hypothetical protein
MERELQSVKISSETAYKKNDICGEKKVSDGKIGPQKQLDVSARLRVPASTPNGRLHARAQVLAVKSVA